MLATRLYGDNNGMSDMAQYMVHIISVENLLKIMTIDVRKLQSLSALNFFMN